MNTRKLKKTYTTTIILVLAITCVANASLGTVNIEHDGYGASGQLNVWGGGKSGTTVHGGVYMLNKNGDTGQGNMWPDGSLGSFCMELSESVPTSLREYEVVMPQDAHEPTTFLGESIGSAKAEYLRELWGRFFDVGWVGTGSFTPDQNDNAEAFAAAVWEIVYEDLPGSPNSTGGWDVTVDGTTGEHGFYCTGANAATANTWLGALDGTGSKADLRAFVYDGYQDFLVEVPEPATMALLGLGSLVLLRKRRVV